MPPRQAHLREAGPYLLTVDPGLRGCGLALFQVETGSLHRALYVPNAEPFVSPGGPTGPAAWVAMAAVVAIAATHHRGAVLVEQMKVYAPGQGKSVNAADLLELAGVAGAIVGQLSTRGWTPEGVLAAAWKGQVPKHIHVARTIAKCEARGERDAVTLPRQTTLQHNVWDAVGLGYWRLGV